MEQDTVGGSESAMPSVLRDQGNSFKTAFFGFDKEDVIRYIDHLVRDVAQQKSILAADLSRLTEQNRLLSEQSMHFAQQIGDLQSELLEEKEYNQSAHEREELFRRAVSMLQEKVAFLQTQAQPSLSSDHLHATLKEKIERSQEIVARLRAGLEQKDATILQLTEELSSQKNKVSQQDLLLSERENLLEEKQRILSGSRMRIAEQSNEIRRMTGHIVSLEDRIHFLEERRREVSASFHELRERLSLAISQQQSDRRELDSVRERLRRESAERADAKGRFGVDPAHYARRGLERDPYYYEDLFVGKSPFDAPYDSRLRYNRYDSFPLYEEDVKTYRPGDLAGSSGMDARSPYDSRRSYYRTPDDRRNGSFGYREDASSFYESGYDRAGQGIRGLDEREPPAYRYRYD